MLALVKKDFLIYHPLVYMTMGLFILAIMLVQLPAIFAMVIGVFATALSSFTYDEKNKVNLSVAGMPVSKQTMVISRYLYSLSILLATLFLEWIGTIVTSNPNFEPYIFKDFLIFFAVGLVLFAVCYPILYFFNKSYMALAFIFVLIVAGSFFTIDASVHIMGMTGEIVFNRLDKGFALLAETYIPFQPYLVVLIAAIGLFIGSIKVSSLLLQRKDLS